MSDCRHCGQYCSPVRRFLLREPSVVIHGLSLLVLGVFRMILVVANRVLEFSFIREIPLAMAKLCVCFSKTPRSISTAQHLQFGHIRPVITIGSQPFASASRTNQDERISSGKIGVETGQSVASACAPGCHSWVLATFGS